MKKRSVLILCTGNSARSQMAEGILRQIAGDNFDVESAGVEPSSVRSEAIDVMREIGVDISSHRSKSVDEFVNQQFDYVITVCDHAKDNCPIFPGHATRIHWSFEDPAAVRRPDEKRLTAFRSIRDEISERLEKFVADQTAG